MFALQGEFMKHSMNETIWVYIYNGTYEWNLENIKNVRPIVEHMFRLSCGAKQSQRNWNLKITNKKQHEKQKLKGNVNKLPFTEIMSFSVFLFLTLLAVIEQHQN